MLFVINLQDMFEVVNITFIDILDVILVTFLLYWIIRILRGTSAKGIFTGIILIYVVWIVASALKMKLLSFILEQLLGVGIIAIFIIFQPEIRRFLFKISSKYNSALSTGFLKRWFKTEKDSAIAQQELSELVGACDSMAKSKTGALIVIQHSTVLEDYIQTGDTIAARINRRLIESIFFKNSPLHDGAMIISRTRIIAARCTLPMTDRQDISPKYGMRHRAAIGVSELTDASVIVVSEETGEISFVRGGVMTPINDTVQLRNEIVNSYR